MIKIKKACLIESLMEVNTLISERGRIMVGVGFLQNLAGMQYFRVRIKKQPVS